MRKWLQARIAAQKAGPWFEQPEPPEWVNDGGGRLVQEMIDVSAPDDIAPVLIPGASHWVGGTSE